MSERAEKLKEELRFKHRVEGEVYDRVMQVFKHDRQISNPEELYDAIFGHPNIQIVRDRKETECLKINTSQS